MVKSTPMKAAPTKKTPEKFVSKKAKGKRKLQRLRGSQDSFRSLLLNHLKVIGGRQEIETRDIDKATMARVFKVPVQKRAGYPITLKKGGVDPAKWKTREGKQVLIDFSRETWLPDDFAQGLKSTNKLACKKGDTGGTYCVYMNPEGRTFYHKWQIEDAMKVKLGPTHGWNGVKKMAELSLEQMNLDSDDSFFKLLSDAEAKVLPPVSEFYFAVVSARRATQDKGLKGIATVQAAIKSAGVEPVWYVDAESFKDYEALGLKVKIGGKLTPSRNMALKDARAKGKICVQCSDDISSWEYRHGPQAKKVGDVKKDMDAVNAAHDNSQHFVISPVCAARFMVAKMRAAPEDPKPKLGGVYCLGSCSRTFGGGPLSRYHFIIGDFIIDDKSDILFDESITLKEDYDFTCSHLAKYGSVMRFNRMTISARHYTNEGGACSIRDKKGTQEQMNIKILKRKWPNAIFDHRTRKNEVNLRWKDKGEAGEAPTASRARKGAMKKVVVNRAVSKKAIAKTSPTSVKKTIVKKTNGCTNLPPNAVLACTEKESKTEYISLRCKQVAGKTVSEACNGSINFTDAKGNVRIYRGTDCKYDIACGVLVAKGKGSKN